MLGKGNMTANIESARPSLSPFVGAGSCMESFQQQSISLIGAEHGNSIVAAEKNNNLAVREERETAHENGGDSHEEDNIDPRAVNVHEDAGGSHHEEEGIDRRGCGLKNQAEQYHSHEEDN